MADTSTSNINLSDTDNKNEESSVLQAFQEIDFQNGTTLYDQVEAAGDKLLTSLSPLTASLNHALLTHSKPIPDPTTTMIRRCSGRQGLWITSENHDLVLVSMVAQISPDASDSKVGIDSLRRACAKIYVAHPYAPQPSSDEQQKIYDGNKERFFELLNFLQVNTTQYVDHNGKEDSIITWVDIHSLGHYGLVCKTLNIFENVPSNSHKTKTSMQLMNFKGKLPDPKKLRAAEMEKNLKAMEVEAPIEGIVTFTNGQTRELIFLKTSKLSTGSWATGLTLMVSFILWLSIMIFSEVKLRIPDMYDPQGILVHPIDYEELFSPGSMVHVTLSFRMWDITRTLSGGPINKPNRLCSNVIESMRLLSDDADDLRLWLHEDAIKERNRIIQEHDSKEAAKAVREEIEKEEMIRAEETALKVKVVADQKKKRLADLRLQSAATSVIAADETTPMDLDSTSSTLPFSEVGHIQAVGPATPSTSALLNSGESSSPNKRKPADVVATGAKVKGRTDNKRAKRGADSTTSANTSVQNAVQVDMEVDLRLT
ncbi:hypothetical protein BDP27DRAFT_1365776 [Rhodocollybia butyracea]|uniref:Uncharacterized protein n=1 Tax=Rhodocollybia butyracea TaxID=206335 RepID=A0A9P5PID1_9AGAR|nr:hypothetical protein BDP27DRAFT_1365776 [Rhodocollybia butyracea]